ncbi:uncharacterized protein LOC124356068 [Homalodisca vitripennis]|uniref:uncharacterized protein LOC124356068 n=1 Tax=Homalodisca vitripennis TaxID=197043 RepID=UPI001EEA713E|nr:uncharacterized protein LOC124356068 [Homalodisca vitripennis]
MTLTRPSLSSFLITPFTVCRRVDPPCIPQPLCFTCSQSPSPLSSGRVTSQNLEFSGDSVIRWKKSHSGAMVVDAATQCCTACKDTSAMSARLPLQPSVSSRVTCAAAGSTEQTSSECISTGTAAAYRARSDVLIPVAYTQLLFVFKSMKKNLFFVIVYCTFSQEG